jgi:ribosome-binding factor A
MTRRTDRVADLIREEISRLLIRGLKDTHLGFVTVTGASVSPDLHTARVFVSVLGSEEEKKATLAALNRARGHLRSQVGHNLGLRHAPELHFQFDQSIERAGRIEEIFHELSRAAPAAPAPEEASPDADGEPGPDPGESSGPGDGRN